MAVVARTWIPLEGNTAAKMNTIRDDLQALDTMAGWNNGQYGVATIAAGTTASNITLNAISERAVITLLGATLVGSANVQVGVLLTKLSSTSLTATRVGTTGDVLVSWAVNDPRG